MTPYEQVSDLSSERMLLSRFWTTPAEMYRSQVTLGKYLSTKMEGRKFLLRSDFPVSLYVDGNLVGCAGAPCFPPFYRFNLGRDSIRQRDITFKFPKGWGGTGGVGGTETPVDAEILGRHGNCCLDAAWSDDADPLPPIPNLLPHTSFVIGPTGIGTGPAGTWGGAFTIANNTWQIPFNQKLPQELWIKHLSYRVTNINGGHLWEQYAPHLFSFGKSDSPVGDAESWLYLPLQSTQRRVADLNLFKIPLRSLYAQYAAETPTNQVTISGSPRITAINLEISIHAAYLL